jgi:hypothetical protein
MVGVKEEGLNTVRSLSSRESSDFDCLGTNPICAVHDWMLGVLVRIPLVKAA